MEEDRMSQLPEHVLEHVISLLPQKDAVRTCVLSKSWRHLGPTRPKIEFHQSYRESKEKFSSVVENTLQRYLDQKLSVQEFILETCPDNSGSNYSCWLLNKWVVRLQMLKRLELHHLRIEPGTFEKIMSSCPLIEHLVLYYCWGLRTIKVKMARNLKHLECHIEGSIDRIEIDDDAPPSLETIRIMQFGRNHPHYHHNNYFFPRLKSLFLFNVHLTTSESFNNLSSLCPFLEKLELLCCSSFTEFKLTSRSIKRFSITNSSPIEAAYFDVPNILYFELRNNFYLPLISFATTSREWKSRIHVKEVCSFSKADVLSTTWSLKLHEFLKALSLSQISLHISCLPNFGYDDGGGSCEPLVVEHLCLTAFFRLLKFQIY